jgi:2,3-bisphosphoglycerate-dependent phosphoglycerate mutase
MAYLVLIRHGQSVYNEQGLWTGWTDVSLTEKGKAEAREAAAHISDIPLHKAYTSTLSRTHETLAEIKLALDTVGLETIEHEALNERHYGDYTGKNKWDIQTEIGNENFHKLRREWDHPIPNGETLKDVHDRVVPFFKSHILADLVVGKNVILSSHGNTLRALVKYLDNMADNDIHTLEIGTGQVIVYDFDNSGSILSKEIRSTGSKL